MGFPADRKLPYVMCIAAKYLSQQAGWIPRIGPSNAAAWWSPFRSVLSIESNHEYIERALHNMALFLYSTSPIGTFDAVDEDIMFLDEKMFGLWAKYSKQFLPDERDKDHFPPALMSLREDRHFIALTRDPRSTFLLEFMMTMRWWKKRTSSPYLYVPSLTDVAIILSEDPRYARFTQKELDLAAEAWSYY